MQFQSIQSNFCPRFQIILQEIEDENQQVVEEKSLTVFIRKWNPSTMTLGPFNEITIYGKCIYILNNRLISYSKPLLNTFFSLDLDKDNMKSLLSLHSGIPEENVEFAKVNLNKHSFTITANFAFIL